MTPESSVQAFVFTGCAMVCPPARRYACQHAREIKRGLMGSTAAGRAGRFMERVGAGIKRPAPENRLDARQQVFDRGLRRP